ncbi:DNA-binding GntR family transcriptional regulator [Variovorax sp. SG517]|uniref:GntR family transcriptional regulator n=1 Tax=Variovorax sp. SG517 TaxID=2587117 RepID=UPI00159EA26C|nr:GntR family transcriptional regulator [Variovorax sp. SG517]NVM92415.1 DNA-binding GntR family transcriptional regulator [Variovorax sp. SG517]
MTTSRPEAATPPAFSSIQVPDLVGVVEAQLQQAILSGRIAPGERIVEAELARQMGVSRAPVREAARRLESLGLLISRPRHGFAVRTVSPKQVNDLYEVRIQLELLGASLACTHATDAELAQLDARVDDMVERAETLSSPERVALDLDFHFAISALSGNHYLHRLFDNMQTEVRMFLALSEDSYGDLKALAETHRPIAKAMMARDVGAVEHALRYHLETAKAHVRGLFTKP